MDRLTFTTKIMADDDGMISCLAWPYGKPDRIGDIAVKGALTVDLPMPMLAFHDLKNPVGSWTEKTDAEDGLYFKGPLLAGKVAFADEIKALVDAGAIRAVSIGIIVKKSKPRKGGGREILEGEIFETSLVTVGMHPGARLTSAKSVVEAIRIADAINRATAQFGRN